MPDTKSTLNPTVEQVLEDAGRGRPRPLLECSAEEAAEVWGAVPNTEMDATDIDGWDAADPD